MSALAPAPGPTGPAQGPTRGANDPAATAILTQMVELAHHFLTLDPDPEDQAAMSQIVQHLGVLSQRESTESAPGPQHVGGPQGLGAPFQAALQHRGLGGP